MKLKEADPGKYKMYLQKQKIRAKERRQCLKKQLSVKKPSDSLLAKQAHLLRQQREKQRKYLEKKKKQETGLTSSSKPVPPKKQVVLTRYSIQAKREYNREKKRKERENQSCQKKMWIRKKDRERKAKKRLQMKQSSTKLDVSSPFNTQKKKKK